MGFFMIIEMIMSEKTGQIEKQFSKFNCAQTVFSLFAEELSRPPKVMLPHMKQMCLPPNALNSLKRHVPF
jgi:hypothetical protein